MTSDMVGQKLLMHNLLLISPSLSPSVSSKEGYLTRVDCHSEALPLMTRPKSSPNVADLPYQSRVQRAIGHIYSHITSDFTCSVYQSKMSPSQLSSSYYIAKQPTHKVAQKRIIFRYQCSSTAPSGGVPSGDSLPVDIADVSQHAFNESRNTSGAEGKQKKKEVHQIASRNTRWIRNGSYTSLSDQQKFVEDMVVGSEESFRLIPKQKSVLKVSGHHSPMNSSKTDLQLNSQTSASSLPHYLGPLAISGFGKSDAGNGTDVTEEVDFNGSVNGLCAMTMKPPTPGLLNTTLRSTTVSSSRRGQRGSNGDAQQQYHQSSESNKMAQNKKNLEAEPKYADPIAGASPSFQARLSELASLESETVRWERLRKLKKKNKDRDD